MDFSISVIGPTGSGKTGLALALAQRLPIEIINADIGQMYQPFSIGVAQPTASERAMCPHHLFSFLIEPKDFSIAVYREYVEVLVAEIVQRGNIPVFVGGSTFYQQSLFKKIPSLVLDEKLVLQHEQRLDLLQDIELWEELFAIDPARAKAIHRNDRYRLLRALHIWYGTGRQPSSFSFVLDPVTKEGFALIIRLPRNVLYERINQRTNQMLSSGWEQEVAALTPEWKDFANKKGLIGYRDIQKARIASISGSITDNVLQKIISSIQQQTRNYAKRQETFFKGLARDIDASGWGKGVCTDLTLSSLDLYIEQIEQIYKRQV